MAFSSGPDKVRTMKIQTLQKIRISVLTLSLILFPVTLYYLSPVVSLMGAAAGIVTGSVLVFCAQLIIALFLGRSFCSWLCPAGAIADQMAFARSRRVRVKRLAWIKYGVWGFWLAALLYFFRRAGGIQAVHFGYETEGGLSVASVPGLISYTMVVLAFFLISLAAGRRAGCHSLCWMAPFMIIGRRLGLVLRVPSLRIKTNPESCVSCGLCTSACPMSLEVETLVKTGSITDNNCILCGRCIAACQKNSLSWSWRNGR